jgi:hypothetical protein
VRLPRRSQLAIGALDDHVGLAQGPVHVPRLEPVAEVHQVAGKLRVELGRVRPQGVDRVEDRRQLLVLHLDETARLRRDLLGLGRHRRHLVPDAPHNVPLEGEVVPGVAERALLDVGARDHPEDAGQRLRLPRVEVPDPRVGHPGPQDPAPDHPGHLEVGEVPDGAGHLLDRVQLRDAGADDPERLRVRRHRTASASARIRAAATSTALTIFV